MNRMPLVWNRRARLIAAAALGGCAIALTATTLACRAQLATPDVKADFVDKTPPTPVPALPGVKVLLGTKAEDLNANWAHYNDMQPTQWTFENGVMTCKGGDIRTKETYRDFQLHVEFMQPYEPEKKGQERGNSGVYLQGRYELQVLDSLPVADPGKGDEGAIYNISAPLTKPYKGQLRWNTYDISFRAPRFADGKKVEPARATVILNGIVVQNNTIIPDVTGGSMDKNEDQPGPIRFQDHGHPVKFRNVWILPLPEQGAEHY